MKLNEMARQGDVLVKKVFAAHKERQNAISRMSRGISAEDGKVILARGEHTGHHHFVPAEHAALFTMPFSEKMMLHVEKPTELQHQEHDPIQLSPGYYEVQGQREYVPGGGGGGYRGPGGGGRFGGGSGGSGDGGSRRVTD